MFPVIKTNSSKNIKNFPNTYIINKNSILYFPPVMENIKILPFIYKKK